MGKILVYLRKKYNPLKIVLAFELLESVPINILEPLPESWLGFKYTVVIADRCTSLVQVIPLRRIRSADAARVILNHWVYKYGQPKMRLSDDGKQLTSKSF